MEISVYMKKRFFCIFFVLCILLVGCGQSADGFSSSVSDTPDAQDAGDAPCHPYGVFIGLSPEDGMDCLYEYETVIIDGQYFSKEKIADLHAHGQTVYSYLNIGSLENFRDYYDAYADLTLGAYENWEEEAWIDVSEGAWQEKILTLADELLEKGIDGFFIDNCDVYYVYPTEEIYAGVTKILRDLMDYDKPVIINGGDSFVTQYRNLEGSASDIMTGVNQESVFSCIDFENGTFGENGDTDRAYFQEYIEACAADGCDVYLLEYTTKKSLIAQIESYCADQGFTYYITDSIDLN